MHIKKLYAYAVSLIFPLFGLYSVVGKFGWGHLYLLFFLILALLLKNKTLDKRFVPLIIYTLVQTSVFTVFSTRSDSVELWLKVLQWLLYICVVAFYNSTLFDFHIQLHVIRVVAVVICGYLLLQQVAASLFRYYIPPGIPIFPYIREELKMAYDNLELWGNVYRPRSFFSEPAAFCQVALPILTIELFYTEEKRSLWGYRYAILLIVSIIVSKAGTGYFGLVFIFAAFVYEKFFKKRKIEKQWIVFVILAVAPLAWFAVRNSSIRVVLNRFFSDGGISTALKNEVRFTSLFNMDLLKMDSWRSVLFGKGFSVDSLTANIYLPAFLRHYYCFGLVGVLILTILLFRLFRSGNSMQRILVLLLVVMSVGANALHNSDVMLFMAFAAANFRNTQIVKTVDK